MTATLLLPVTPTMLLIGIAVLIILLVVFMLVVLWRTKKKDEAQPAEETAPMTQPPAGASEDEQRVYESDEAAVRSSVAAAMQFVAENTAGAGGRYRSPWYLVAGAAGSGKSTMLDHCGISQSLRQGVTDFGISHGVQWRFFDAGVLLEVAGEAFIRADKTGSDESQWKSLLRNLVRYRPQRPLDGVVLTIPCTELVGDTAISPAVLGQRAAQISDKLWQIQKWIGLSFPVYVVVTKCDLVAGFKSLATQLPTHCRGQMFGWSNPYNLEAAFSSSWVEQGFDELATDINRLQAEVMVTRHDIADVDDLFLFSGRFQELRRPLRLYLNQIFKQSAYRESLQFRGFYFCGDITDMAGELPQPAQAMAAAASASGSSSAPEHITGEVLGLGTALEPAVQHSPVFITDLFEQKIFPERGLAHPVAKVRLSRNRLVLGSQAACLVAVILLIAGVSVRYRALSRTQEHASVTLNRIDENITSHNYDPAPLPDGIDPAYDPIWVARNLSGHEFQSVFLPTSYFTPMDTNVVEAMIPAFNRLVYTSLRMRLEAELKRLADMPVDENSIPMDIESAALPNHKSYQQLSTFIDDTLRLEDNISLYFTLAKKGSGNVQDLDTLTRALHESTPPLTTNREALDFILKRAGAEPSAMDTQREKMLLAYRDRIANRLHELIHALMHEWVAKNPILAYVDKLKEKIDALNDDKMETYEQLNDLRLSLTDAENLLKRSDLSWIAREKFTPADSLQIKLDQIFQRPAKENVLLCDSNRDDCPRAQNLRSQIESHYQEDFQELRNALFSKKTAISGQLVVVKDGALQLAPDAVQARELLDQFLTLPFVKAQGGAEIRAGMGPQEQLFWNKDQLQAAVQYKDAYLNFEKSELTQVAPNVQRTFEQVALDRLDANLSDLIARAQTFQPLPPAADPEHLIAPELQSFQEASGDLNTLLVSLRQLGLNETYDELLQITTTQAANLLARIDQSFDEKSPYGAGTNFKRWTGENTPTQAGFDLRSPDDLAQYLNVERQDVQQYAAYATPVVNFLTAQAAFGGKRPELLLKWRPLIADLQKANDKKPGTSIAALEDFIAADMDKATPENCQAAFLAKAAPAGGNYFVRTRESLRQALADQCHVLARQIAVRNYLNLAGFFNEHLAGRFPFADRPAEQNPSEADPQDIMELYRLYDANHKSIDAGLEAGSFGDNSRRVVAFLNQIRDLRALFGPLLGAQPEAVPSFDFVAAFRVNTNHEVNGNQIIDWTLQVGTDTYRNHEPQRTGRWNFGDPVKVTLRWAKDSPSQPSSVYGNARITSRSVVFDFRDSWALLSMMALHRPEGGDFDRGSDSDPQTLVFTINDTNGDPSVQASDGTPQTKVFIRIKLRPAGKPENLKLTGFPTGAPSLGQGPTRTQAGNTGGVN